MGRLKYNHDAGVEELVNGWAYGGICGPSFKIYHNNGDVEDAGIIVQHELDDIESAATQKLEAPSRMAFPGQPEEFGESRVTLIWGE